MEKLIYLLWNEGMASEDAFRDRLLAKLPTRLPSLGASSLTLSVTDSDVASGSGLHIGPEAPDALVTFWMEAAQDRQGAEHVLRRFARRLAGYLVVESRPLVYDPPDVGPGERTPGFNLVGCIEPRPGLSHEEFVHLWHSVHRDVAVETQSSFSYVRNEVVRALTDRAPDWAAVVEEGFPPGALTDPHVFYDADGSEDRYRANLSRMVESCQAFLDMKRVDSHPMSEYRF